MKLLLDTHSFLWFVLGDSRLGATAKAAILDSGNEKYVSPATHWEIAIKISIGKYALPGPFEDFITKAVQNNGFLILPIEPKHSAVLATLPFHHRDPFDRMLIAQALSEQFGIVSNDSVFDAYAVTRVW